jgi:hypothetical protein
VTAAVDESESTSTGRRLLAACDDARSACVSLT